MKKILLLLVLVSNSIFSQTTYVPDDNFENYLETHDANGNVVTLGDATSLGNGIVNDNNVPTAKIATVITLFLRNYGPTIQDLTGIEDFTALENLDMIFHDLQSLDVSHNLALKNIWLNTNSSLTTLDFTNNINLRGVDLQSTSSLTELNFASSTLITFLDIRNTKLTEIDLSIHPNIGFLNASGATLLEKLDARGTSASTINTTGCSSLTCISVDNVADAIAGNGIYANWTEDNTNVYQFDKCDSTYVPDDNFEARLETLGMGNGIDNDDYVLTANIENVTSLNVTSQNISDPTGIEAFLALEQLRISSNSLTSLDVSANTNLMLLVCGGNLLTELELGNNNNLIDLECEFNQLTELDVSNNSGLVILKANTNNLSTLNVNNGTNNQLTVFTAQNNPNLDCIHVDDDSASYLSSWTKDATASFSEHCDETYVPDNNFENYLETHNASGNTVTLGDASSMGNGIANDDYVLTSRISGVTALSLYNQGINVLTGIEDFLSLTNLNVDSNNLVAIDLSNNINLEHLQLENNTGLTSIDVSALTSLKDFWCFNTGITALDVSNNTLLESLYVYDTTISVLDLSANVSLDYLVCQDNQLSSLDISNNPLLTAVYAKDNSISNVIIGNNTVLETLSLPSNMLTSIDLSALTSLKNLYLTSNSITSLDLSNNSALFQVYVQDNDLTTLDVRNGSNELIGTFTSIANYGLACISVDDPTQDYLSLWSVDTTTFGTTCNQTYVPDDNFESYLETHDASGNTVTLGDASSMGNGIANDDQVLTSRIDTVTILNVSNLTIADLTGIEAFSALLTLDCSRNSLTALNVTQNVALTSLNCFRNMITTLDVTQNINIAFLSCTENELTNLNVTQNAALVELRCTENTLATVDVTQNPLLEELYCSKNGMTSLNVTQNPALITLSCYTNTLTSLDVTQNPLLKSLDCVENQLVILDVTQNPVLEFLICTENNLTSLDVSQNTLLDELYCEHNAITNLDVSNCTVLEELACSYNALTSLNVKNGNNMSMTNFETEGNSNLLCVLVDDVTYSNNTWTRKDSQTAYSDTDCNAKLNPVVFLQGAIVNPNTGEENLMRDDLRIAGLIPTTSPYGDGATCSATLFDITGNNAIVDWVLIELRDPTDATIIIESKSALLTRSGLIVNVNGVPSITYDAWATKYNVAIKHRNHLGIMTNTSQNVDFVLTPMDFSDGSITTFGSNAQTTFGMPNGIVAMWAGNVNNDTVVQYSGTTPDTPTLLSIILNDPGNFLNFPTYAVTDYNINDVNMDGITQYSGVSPDTPFILQNVLAHPGNFLNFSTYQIAEQLPEN